MSTKLDDHYMRRALALARRGQGRTSPNPCVGAVVVRGGNVVGEGYHRQAGQPHAEVEALDRASAGGRRGGTLYVTLEPCSTQGRTPPCTEAIIRAGIRRVVVAARDPNPRHNGRGLQQLRRAGIKVEQGLRADEATRLNAAFNHWIVTGRPLVIAKAAISLDGRIATRTGDSRWITDREARQAAHRLRAEADAVMVGAGTVRQDDPRLTLRHGVRGVQPWRVVVDGRGVTRPTARLYSDRLSARTIVATTARSAARWRRQLEAAGVRVITLPAAAGHVSLPRLLRALGQLPITSVLVEGGAGLFGALFDRHLVDEVRFFFAPLVLGGTAATGVVGGRGAGAVRDAVRLTAVRWHRLGQGQMLCSGQVEK